MTNAPGGAPLGPIARIAAPALAAGGILLALFLAVGFLLPRTITVEREIGIAKPPSEIFPWINDLSAWSQWTKWGDVQSRSIGPEAGLGAAREWDDPAMGSGRFTLTRSEESKGVSYEVEVNDGAVRVAGEIALEADGSEGALVRWTEVVKLSRNPLLGWTGLTLEDSQGEQLAESLRRLKALAEQ